MELCLLWLFGLGLFVGGLGTLIGAGGGFMLMPILMFLYPDMPVDVITSISLFVVFFNATSGSLAYAKMRRIDYKTGWIFGLATLPGAILGIYLTNNVDRLVFDKIMGAMLILIAGFLFLKPQTGAYSRKSSAANSTHRSITDSLNVNYQYDFSQKLGVYLSFIVGMVSSFLGIGGGIIHVPAMISLLNFPTHIATATSHFMLALMAFAGTVVHLTNGTLQQGGHIALTIGAGVIIGAQIGAPFSNKVRGQTIVQALALALTMVGIRLIFV